MLHSFHFRERLWKQFSLKNLNYPPWLETSQWILSWSLQCSVFDLKKKKSAKRKNTNHLPFKTPNGQQCLCTQTYTLSGINCSCSTLYICSIIIVVIHEFLIYTKEKSRKDLWWILSCQSVSETETIENSRKEN